MSATAASFFADAHAAFLQDADFFGAFVGTYAATAGDEAVPVRGLMDESGRQLGDFGRVADDLVTLQLSAEDVPDPQPGGVVQTGSRTFVLDQRLSRVSGSHTEWVVLS